MFTQADPVTKNGASASPQAVVAAGQKLKIISQSKNSLGASLQHRESNRDGGGSIGQPQGTKNTKSQVEKFLFSRDHSFSLNLQQIEPSSSNCSPIISQAGPRNQIKNKLDNSEVKVIDMQRVLKQSGQSYEQWNKNHEVVHSRPTVQNYKASPSSLRSPTSSYPPLASAKLTSDPLSPSVRMSNAAQD